VGETDLLNHLGGELDGVVAAVEAEEALEKDNQESREGVGDKEDDGEEDKEDEDEEAEEEESEHAAHGERRWVPLLLIGGFSGPLPFRRRRSSSSHSTTLSKDSSSSTSRRFFRSWLAFVDNGLIARRSGGKRGPRMLARTSLKGTARELSTRGREKGDFDLGWEEVWGFDRERD